jgi:hypothetical protein
METRFEKSEEKMGRIRLDISTRSSLRGPRFFDPLTSKSTAYFSFLQCEGISGWFPCLAKEMPNAKLVNFMSSFPWIDFLEGLF